MVDSGGQVLFADDPDATLEPYLQRDDVTARAVDRGRNGQSGVYRGGYKSRESGVRYVQAYAPVAETDWIVITHVPVGQAYALEREVTQSLLVLLGIAVIGIAVIGGTVGRSTVAAVRRLATTSHSIAPLSLRTNDRRHRQITRPAPTSVPPAHNPYRPLRSRHRETGVVEETRVVGGTRVVRQTRVAGSQFVSPTTDPVFPRARSTHCGAVTRHRQTTAVGSVCGSPTGSSTLWTER